MTKWTQHERFLREAGAKYEYREVPLARMDWTGSFNLQARLGGTILDEAVEEYARAMRQGDEFPPIFVTPHPDGAQGQTYLIRDGIQRGRAATEAGLTTVQAFVITTSDEAVLDLVTWGANFVLNGHRPPEDEHLYRAVAYAAKYPHLTLRDVARKFRVDEGKLSRQRRIDLTKARMQLLNLDPAKVGTGAVESFHGLDLDRVLIGFYDLCVKAALQDGPLFDRILADVKAGRSEAEQLAAIETWRQDPEVRERIARVEGGLPPTDRSPRVSIFATLKGMTGRLAKADSVHDLDMASDEHVDRFEELVTALNDEVERLVGAWRRS
jgi:hypothetical protein